MNGRADRAHPQPPVFQYGAQTNQHQHQHHLPHQQSPGEVFLPHNGIQPGFSQSQPQFPFELDDMSGHQQGGYYNRPQAAPRKSASHSGMVQLPSVPLQPPIGASSRDTSFHHYDRLSMSSSHPHSQPHSRSQSSSSALATAMGSSRHRPQEHSYSQPVNSSAYTPSPGLPSYSQPELEVPYAESAPRPGAVLTTASTLSTPSGTNPAYGDAFISPPSVEESPDPLNLISPVSSLRGATGRTRQVSPSPNGSWFSSQSRSLSGLEHAMGDSMTPTQQNKRKADFSEMPHKRQKVHQGPSPVKADNFYSAAVRPNMQRPPPPTVEVIKSPSGPSTFTTPTSAKRGRGRPKGSKSKPRSSVPTSEHAPFDPSPSIRHHPPKPKVIAKAARPKGTTFTSSLPLALPDGFDSDSAEEWDKDGTFEIDEGTDSDFEGTDLSQPAAAADDDAQWQTPQSKSTLSGKDAPTTSVIKNTQRRSVLAKLAELIEDALEAESNLPDPNEYANGIPQPAASFFVIIDDTAILKPAQLQKLGKLIRSCAALKPGPRLPKTDESGPTPESLRSLHDLEVGDLQKVLRMLSAVIRVGESVNPFRSTTANTQASSKASTSKPAKKPIAALKRSPSGDRSSRGSPSDDEEEEEGSDQEKDKDIDTGREELGTPPLSSSPQKNTAGPQKPTKVNEHDQQVLAEELSRASTSLMAVDCCLSLLSVPHLDQSLLSEDIIRPCFDVLRSALELIVYPYVEACSSIGITTTHPLLAAWVNALAPAGGKNRRGGKKKLPEADILTSTPNKSAQGSASIFTGCAEYLSRIFRTCCACMGQASKLVNLPSMSLSESIIFSAIYAGMGPFFAIEPELSTGTTDAAKAAARGRAAMDALASGSGGGGAAMKLLRLPALNLLRVIFARHVDQREWMMEELLTSLTKLPDMKKNRRQHILKDGNAINSITALLLQLIQTAAHGIRDRVASAEPGATASSADVAIEIATAAQARTRADDDNSDVDEEEGAFVGSVLNRFELKTSYDLRALRHAIDGPAQAAKSIATFLMAKISPAKVTKSSSDFSYASVMDNFVTDLLTTVFLPEWPAAVLLLKTICRAFDETLHDPKSTPDARGVALEHTGTIAAYMRQSRLKMKTRQPTAESQAQGATMTIFPLGEIEQKGDTDSLNDLNNHYMMVLDYLSAAEADDGMTRSAGDFLLSQWGSELASCLIRTNSVPEVGRQGEADSDGTRSPDPRQKFLAALHQSLLLVSKYSKDTSGQQHSVFDVRTTGDYEDLKAMSEQLVHTTSFTIRFDSLCHLLVDSLDPQSAGNRTKALRGLTAIYNVDPGLLKLPPIRAAIEKRLTDDSASVREAAVNLLGKYLLTQPEEGEALYEQLRERTFDTGLAVRKRALKLLASLYRIFPSMSTRIDICLRVVRCVSDEDVGIQEMVISILGEFWLKMGSEDRGNSPRRSGSDSGNDDEEGGNGNITQELGDDVSIIVSVASQIRDKPSPLEEVFRRFGKTKSAEGSDKLGQRLRALIDLLVGQLTDDAMSDASPSQSSEVLAKIKTIHLIISTNPSVLSVGKAKILLPFVKTAPPKTSEELAMLETLLRMFRISLPLMPKTALAFAGQLETLLRSLLNHPPMNLPVLQEIVACFTTVIRCHTHNFTILIKTTAALLKALKNVSARLLQESSQGVSPRVSVIMAEAALLCEHADLETVIKEKPELEKDVRAACGPGPVQEQVFELMLDIRQNSPAHSALALRDIGALFRGFPHLMETDQGKLVMEDIFASGQAQDKETLLRIFSEFLASEEKKNAMDESKKQAAEARSGPSTSRGKTADKVNMKELVGDTDTFAASSVSSNLVAQYMDGILQGSLAVETPVLQRVAMDVLSSVVLQGLSHPYQCVPTLVCLQTLENRDVAQRARRMHEHLWSKHGTLLAPLGTRHVQATFEFQSRLHRHQPQDLRGYRMDAATSMPTALLHSWYSLLRDKRQTRLDFVRGVCKLLDIDTSSSSECSEEIVLLSRYVADNLATLDYKTVEEVFVVVRELQRILAVTGVQVKACGEAYIKGLRDTVPRRAVVLPTADAIEMAGASGGNATFDGIDFGEGDDAEESEPVVSEPVKETSSQAGMGAYTQEMLAMDVDTGGEEKQSASGTARMSIAMGTALLLRNHLKRLYGLSEARCNKYVPGKKQSAGADRPAVRKVIGGEPLSFDTMPLALDSVSSTPVAIEQLLRFEDLMNEEGTLNEDADEWQLE